MNILSAHKSGKSRQLDSSLPASRFPLAAHPGFTIVELLLVMALAGILGAITIPQLVGVYNNQMVINTANEVVSAIKVAQNKALANDQDIYVTNPPQPDCTNATNYVDKYGMKIISATNYRVYYYLRDQSKDKSTNCNSVPAVRTVDVANYYLPSSVTFLSGVGEVVTYATTSGQPTLSAGIINNSNSIVVSGTRTNMKYYICLDTGGRAYAKTTACP